MKGESDSSFKFSAIEDFIQGIFAIQKQINQLKESEANWRTEAEKLQRCNNEYRSLIENLPQKICIKDKYSAYIYCNGRFLQGRKIQYNDILGKTDFDLYPEEIARKNIAEDKRVMEKGMPEEIEDHYTIAGEEVFLHKIKAPVKNENGEIVGTLEIISDNKEKRLIKAAEEALKQEAAKNERLEETLKSCQQRYDYVLEHAPMGIWIYLDERIKFVNQKGAEILGYSREELISMPFKKLLHPEYQEVLIEKIPNFSETSQLFGADTLAFVHKDGSIRWVANRTGLIDWEGKRATIIYGKDITNGKKMEQDLKNSLTHIREIVNSIEESMQRSHLPLT